MVKFIQHGDGEYDAASVKSQGVKETRKSISKKICIQFNSLYINFIPNQANCLKENGNQQLVTFITYSKSYKICFKCKHMACPIYKLLI